MKKAEAVKAGQRALAKLSGTGWKVRVWENLGWHVMVANQGVQIYIDHSPLTGEDSYWGMVNADGEDSSGDVFWDYPQKHSKDPNVIVRHLMKYVRKFRDKIVARVDAIDANLVESRKLARKRAKR